MFSSLRNEGRKEKFEASQSGCVDQKIHQMYQRILPVHRGLQTFEEEAEDPGIKRAPVGIDGIVPIAAPVCVADVEVGDAVRVHGEARGPGVSSAESEGDDPAEDA